MGLEVAIDAQAEPPLLDRLALPRRLHERHGTRTLVVFDEFQDVLAAAERVDAVIRSEIQHHGDAAGYVFAGSHVGMMRELFADRRRAFYGQASPVELPPLPADALLAAGQGHPQRTMLLAHAVWGLTESGQTASEETWREAYELSMRQVRDELRAIWDALATSQRRVLTTIAENTAPLYSTGHGGSRGGAVQAAVRVLEDRGEITKDSGTRSRYRLTDPLLAAWVAEGRQGA